MAERLYDRWREFVQFLKEECKAHGQLPGGRVLKENESILKVSLALSGAEECACEFTEEAILHGDLQQLARDFYQRAKAGCGDD